MYVHVHNMYILCTSWYKEFFFAAVVQFVPSFCCSEDLTSTANDIIPSVNDQIGVSLCVAYPGITLTSATGTLTASGAQVTHTSGMLNRLLLCHDAMDDLFQIPSCLE